MKKVKDSESSLLKQLPGMLDKFEKLAKHPNITKEQKGILAAKLSEVYKALGEK